MSPFKPIADGPCLFPGAVVTLARPVGFGTKGFLPVPAHRVLPCATTDLLPLCVGPGVFCIVLDADTPPWVDSNF